MRGEELPETENGEKRISSMWSRTRKNMQLVNARVRQKFSEKMKEPAECGTTEAIGGESFNK